MISDAGVHIDGYGKKFERSFLLLSTTRRRKLSGRRINRMRQIFIIIIIISGQRILFHATWRVSLQIIHRPQFPACTYRREHSAPSMKCDLSCDLSSVSRGGMTRSCYWNLYDINNHCKPLLLSFFFFFFFSRNVYKAGKSPLTI